ncbi:MAG: YdcF family protein [Alphaproteobacteria bacterium]
MRDLFHLLWPVLQPSNALLLLFAAAGISFVFGRLKAARRLTLFATGLTIAIMLLPIQSILMVTLETRFPKPDLPEKIDGIITLGGAMHPVNSQVWDAPQFSDRSERVFETVRLARRYPDATILATGGTWLTGTPSEAEIAVRIISDLGVPQTRILTETRARNTHENALFSLAAVDPAPDATWVLVTSAAHMPRAVGVFRKLGWAVIPYPVDYETDGAIKWFRIDGIGTQLATLDVAARAWAALVAYRVLGLTDALFPAPYPGSGLDSAAESR